MAGEDDGNRPDLKDDAIPTESTNDKQLDATDDAIPTEPDTTNQLDATNNAIPIEPHTTNQRNTEPPNDTWMRPKRKI
jgi:hypothetical protein